jgi:hypothetical protein
MTFEQDREDRGVYNDCLRPDEEEQLTDVLGQDLFDAWLGRVYPVYLEVENAKRNSD